MAICYYCLKHPELNENLSIFDRFINWMSGCNFVIIPKMEEIATAAKVNPTEARALHKIRENRQFPKKSFARGYSKLGEASCREKSILIGVYMLVPVIILYTS